MNNKSLKHLVTHVVRWALPAQCWLCRATHIGTQFICATCAQALPHNRNACSRCALPLSTQHMSTQTNWPPRTCTHCLKNCDFSVGFRFSLSAINSQKLLSDVQISDCTSNAGNTCSAFTSNLTASSISLVLNFINKSSR